MTIKTAMIAFGALYALALIAILIVTQNHNKKSHNNKKSRSNTSQHNINGRPAGAYFPAVWETPHGQVHMLVLHKDKDTLLKVMRDYNITTTYD
jgi:hypothetical protein